MEQNIVKVTVSCPSCGPSKLSPADVTIRNCIDTDEWSYSFLCGGCRLRAAARTSRRAALNAVDAGSTFETWRLPMELHERSDATPITWVDVLDMRLNLIEPDWFEELSK